MDQNNCTDYDKLFYPFLFKGGEANLKEVLEQVRQSTMKKCQEIVTLRRLSLERDGEKYLQTAEAMARAFQQGATLFAFGNGGSTTDAQDLVVDLMQPAYLSWKPLPAVALTNDIAVVTAVGNDVGFENVFKRQIIAFGQKGDIAVGISTSGDSRNVIVALEQAHKQEMLTVAIVGYDGGQLAKANFVDYCLITPSDYIPRIQEAQATVYHTLLHLIQLFFKKVTNPKRRT